MQDLLQRFELMLSNHLQVDDIRTVSQSLAILLSGYDIKKKETALTIYEGQADEEIVKKFLITKMVERLSNNSLAYYQLIIKKFLQKVNKPIKQITTDDILVYFAIRNTKDNISSVSQDNERRILRVFFEFLQVQEYITKNPMLRFSKIKTQKKVKKAFTERELEMLRNACAGDSLVDKRNVAILEVLISTACRVSEVANIKKSDVEKDKIKVLGKGNKERIVYLTPKCQIALENYLAERKDKSPYLFIAQRGNAKICSGAIEKLVRDLGKELGIEAHPHKFRRTAATFALRRGMPIELVSKMLGHADLKTTQIYLELAEQDLELAHKKYC